MRVAQRLIGKDVVVTWRDPCQFDTEGKERFDATKGVAGLPRWREWGVLDNVTDGVVRIVHSVCSGEETQPRWSGTLVPEDLIEKIIVLVPQGEDNGSQPS